MPWLTPDTAPTAVQCRRLFIPDSEEWLAAISGALVELTYTHNWELFGDVTPEEAAERALTMFLEYLQDDCMIGTIAPYATSSPPNGCIPCDGSTFDRVDYPRLYAVLDSAFIVDADTFETPDLRGRTVIGAGTGSGLSARAVGATGGEEEHTLTVAELASHHHQIQQDKILSRTGAVDLYNFVKENLVPGYDTLDTGGDEPHNNMQPFFALKYCMVAK